MQKALCLLLLIFITGGSISQCGANNSKVVPYLVPVTWNDRIDWQQAVLLTETQTKVKVQLSYQEKRQLQFSKHKVALDEPIKEEDVVIGMEVLVKLGVDRQKVPLYATGTVVNQLRVAQYNVTLNCNFKAMPLGVGVKFPDNRVKQIENTRITASSVYNEHFKASNGRLGNSEVWCPSRQDARGSWLQVDLGLPYYLFSIAVQGTTVKRNEWVKSYTVRLSYDGKVFYDVKENTGAIKEFQASRDGLESDLAVALPYRFVRFLPRRYHNYPCMGVEVYGVGPAKTFTVGQQFNLDEIRAMGDPDSPYLLVPFTWNDRRDWRLAKYVTHTGNDVHVKMIPGSQNTLVFNSNEVILNLPSRADRLHTGGAVYAPFARDKKGMAIYSIGRIGLIQNGQYLITPICSKIQKSLPLGIGSASTISGDRIEQLEDHHLTATSSHPNYEPKYGRLGNKKVWCAARDQLRTSRLQVDLGSSYFICSVAVQGHLEGPEEWVTSFKMAVSMDGRKWKFISSSSGSDVFRRTGRRASEFFLGLSTAYRYVSFNPISYNIHTCMGIELYGVGPIKDSLFFDINKLRMHGSACQLQNKCPTRTQCMAGSFPGSYTCKCPEGFMSSQGGRDTVKPGTDEHCRSINPTGKSIVVKVEKLPKRIP